MIPWLGKIIDHETLEISRRDGKGHENPYDTGKIVATNGCFDILHAGHVDFLRRAKSLGDILVVGLNSDKSVKKLKGSSRPINSQAHRAAALAGIAYVDFITIFEEDNASNFLRAAWPHVYAKGGDYEEQSLNREEKSVLDEYFADIKIIPLLPDISTTLIINKIKDNS